MKRNEPKETTVTRHGFTFQELNAYALCCGYIQRVTNGNTRTLELWHESDHYHVRYSDYDRKPVGRETKSEYVRDISQNPLSGFYQVWRTFPDLKTAREVFNNLLRYALPVWFDILGHYGERHSNGKPVWEVVTCEPSRLMAQESLKTYRDNEPGTSFKIRQFKEVKNA